MKAHFYLKVIFLAVVFLTAAPLWGSEPLSEADLDRTVASGYEHATPLVRAIPDTVRPQPSAERPGVVAADHGEEADEDNPSPEGEFSLVAYRSVLPVVMKRMTSSNNGPLARNGRYSLSPVPVTRQRPTVIPIDVRLIPHIAPSAPVGFRR